MVNVKDMIIEIILAKIAFPGKISFAILKQEFIKDYLNLSKLTSFCYFPVAKKESFINDVCLPFST